LTISLSFFFCSTTSAQTSDSTLKIVLDLINKDSLKRTVLDMQNFETRFCAQSTGQNRKVAQYLVDRLHTYGIENARIDSFYVSDYHWTIGDYAQYMYNVIGTLEGTGKTDSTVIIGAHLDAIATLGAHVFQTSPGADDNATGCAVMIEMARIIFENKLKSRHNIDFMAYDAEEFGLLGSRYDAEKRKTANENVIVMLNNDMVGNQSETKAWEVNLRWYDNALEVTEKAKQALLEHTSITPLIPTWATNYSSRQGSDSYAYFLNDFKATMAIENDFSPYYHSPNDLAEYLNFEYCRQIAKMNFVLLADYADIDFSTGSVPRIIFDQPITVFPNPTWGTIQVYCVNDVVINQIDIFDIRGQVVKSLSDIIQQQTVIHIDHLRSGVYFMRIYTNKGITNKKIIKQ
jgi:hypothetical protein